MEPFLRTLSFINVYCVFHVTLDYFWAKHAARRFNLSLSERISVSEKVCSSLNAVYMATASLYLIFIRDVFVPENGIARNSLSANCTSPMSMLFAVYPKAVSQATFPTVFFDMDWVLPAYVGYSIYDCATMYFQDDNHWSMWVHHLVGIYGGVGNIWLRSMSCLSNFALATEITALFVNLLWYAETLNPNRNIAVRGGNYNHDTLSETDQTVLETNGLKHSPKPKNNATLAKTDKDVRVKRKSVKPPPTLLLVTLQMLRTLSFIFFRVTAVPYSFYILMSRGSKYGVSLLGFSEVLITVWNQCSACHLGLLHWNLDRMLMVSALVVQVLFGLLNIVWTLVAVKVLMREVTGFYLRVVKGEKSKRE